MSFKNVSKILCAEILIVEFWTQYENFLIQYVVLCNEKIMTIIAITC